MATDRRYGATKEVAGGYSIEDFREMTTEEKVEVLLEWFFDHYEDPARNMPYESAEGGYQWIWGGPYDANDELQDEFSDVVDFDTIQLAVERIQDDGHEWAPKEPPPDWFDDDTERTPEGGLSYTLPFTFGSAAIGGAPIGSTPIAGGPTPDPWRADVIRRLDDLERLVRPLATSQAMIGHNRPPEPIDDAPLSKRDVLEVVTAIRSIREEALSPAPREDIVEQRASVIIRAGEAVGKWLLSKADRAADEFVAYAAKAGGAAVGWQTINTAFHDAIAAITAWLQHLSTLF